MSVTRVASVPVHPVVLAGVIVFSAYLDADVSVHAALRPFLLVVLAVAVVTVVAVRTLGPLRGPVLVTAGVLIVRSRDILHAGNAVLLIMLAAVVWILVRRASTLPGLHDANRLLNVLTLSLAGGTLGLAAWNGTLARIDLGQGRPFSELSATNHASDPSRPDIYVILLDGYPREDTLHRLFDFDNSAFIGALADRGFEVASASRSNYMYTVMTLLSLLHMRYVHEIPGSAGVGDNYGVSLRALVNRNPVWDELRGRGYLIAANQSPWETVGMRGADLYCGDHMTDFEMYLLRTTWVGSAVDVANPTFRGDRDRDIINDAFDCLDSLSAPTSSPKLVFTHVGGPHLPIVFTRSGGAADLDVFGEARQGIAVTDERFAAAYAEEIEYLNHRVLAAIDRRAQRPDAPIVIVMSDHGSESRLDWTDSSRSDLQERFANFLAAKTPMMPSLFPTDTTPVNLFPILFNAYFGEAIPLREPRFFLSAIHNELLFTEIPDPVPPAAGGSYYQVGL